MGTLQSVGIVGLGLIGGSLARDLAARGVRVHGADSDAAAVRAAATAGVVHTELDGALANLDELDALVLAVPLNAAIDILHRNADQLRRIPLVTDVCSTKYSISEAALRAGLGDRFVGSHPLAGDHRSGWAASRRALFRAAPVYICPAQGAPPGPIELLRALWESIGATPEIMDPAAHDRLLARTSHLPQIAATALARTLAADGIALDRLGPGGRDMTRLAGSSADMWTPIAIDNAAHIAAAIQGLERELATLREALHRSDSDAVHEFLTSTPRH